MSRLLKILFLVSGFYLSTGLFNSAQATDYVCPPEETEKINQQGINWLPNLPPFAPADYSKFYLPFIKSSYPDNTHQDTAKLPNSESVGCLIIYAEKFFNSLYGSHFVPDDIDRVINFALNNNFNPSLFLAIWLEESHAGDRSKIELGCGNAAGFDAQLDCLQNQMHPLLKNTPLFHCFLCGYAGDCTANLGCGWTNSDQIINDKWTAFVQYYNYLTKPGGTKTPAVSPSTTNPLRPNPFDLVKEEQQRQISDPNLALYCAQRPTVVKPPLSPPPALIQGSLYSNFSQFTTPLLSLSSDKTQTDESRRFLADYLEGRAYYETTPESQNPDFFQQVDIFSRSGVFRKLAPQSYQDQLKNAMIMRASANPNVNTITNLYGFTPATTQIHDYELNTPSGKFKLSQLTPKPLDNPQALNNWQNSTTAKIWDYVPMFTREDTKGFVQAVDEPGQNSTGPIEVIHPHLSRTYEVSSALSGLLTPLFPPQNPNLSENFFTPAPWYLDSEKPWWLESDKNTANQWNQSAPICDPQTVVYGSGDLARGGTINTSIYKSTLLPPVQGIRYSPTYLTTYTPFLEQIAANLITGPRAVFSALNPLAEAVTEDWPAAADYNEKNPKYSFSAGRAEAGYKKPGSLGQFFYKYLGSIICQEEKTLAWLQPFLTDQSPSSSLCKTTPPGAGTILSGLAGVCPEGGQEITAQLAGQMQDGHEQFLPNSVTARSEDGRLCITPTMIVIHWSGGWDNDQGNDATYGTLIARDLACQLASDTNDTIIMQPFYETQVEYPWCASIWNPFSINNELAGGYLPSPSDPEYGSVDIRFTDESGNPSRIGNLYKPSQTVFPEKSVVDHAVSAICIIMKQYNIPWTQIYGHYNVPGSGKEDPGKEFLEDYFIPRVKNECN